jgi:hypothetical protein
LAIDAIDWAVRHDVDVISMSFGSPFGPADSPDAIAADNAARAGIVVVATSGNEGPRAYMTGTPASATRRRNGRDYLPGARWHIWRFIWPSSECYGATAGFIDYGPLGAMLKRRVENIWRDFYIIREGYYEIECPTTHLCCLRACEGLVKGFSDDQVETVLSSGLNFRLVTKHWGEEMGLPFHPTEDDLANKYKRRHSYATCSNTPGASTSHNPCFATVSSPPGMTDSHLPVKGFAADQLFELC